ncbi:MAG: hypothetical protein JW832_10725 [Deltaproteobacteria bacterium]|nr:hypothetical protein [Deltaproteobacteria bacterium]
MQNTSRTRIKLIAFFACMMFVCAFAAAPLVHKHSATEQVPLQDYDASCSFVKAEKGSAGGPTQQLLACFCLLLLFIPLQHIVVRRRDAAAPVLSIFTRKVQAPRAPPAR